ncbi:hypothetical protein APC81_04595, partial [Acinetobacter baumannii]
SYCENHSSLIEKLSLGLKSNSKGLVFNGLKEVTGDFYLLEKIDDLFFYDGRALLHKPISKGLFHNII